MPIYDNDGTTKYQIGKVYDNDGTTKYQIGKVYDNDGTSNYLIYSAEEEYFNGGFSSYGYTSYNYSGASLTVGNVIRIYHNVGTGGTAQIIVYIYADLSRITTLQFTFTTVSVTSTGSCHVGTSSTKADGVPNNYNPSQWTSRKEVTGAGTYSVDVSGLSGYQYIVIGTISTTMGSVWECSKIIGI